MKFLKERKETCRDLGLNQIAIGEWKEGGGKRGEGEGREKSEEALDP